MKNQYINESDITEHLHLKMMGVIIKYIDSLSRELELSDDEKEAFTLVVDVLNKRHLMLALDHIGKTMHVCDQGGGIDG